ncbi:RNase adaptor protein for sRNA GlmZ degradation, contains a P-loop ATPase domain [Gulbenkiania indica]|uniref:RNase adaptor protein for sRNA GlmZ degradation, contains a P-loop ATPase domain n=1 Tax=Gulbenkiania indica TaxID=375574 RepID=A0A0K6H216_9NEIS|nr:RNase adapter RapZ [Gulbenkiania indica]CUA85028.1 RNase adaptor protein for sRNA GlmZ degradation, contains a P-loop ATPase domain [Gulbenkiania indica]
MRLILISGLSGSGKSVALRALEDAGYYCVDNLPATLLHETVGLYGQYGYDRIAVSVDVRSGPSLGALPVEMKKLRDAGFDVRLLFLEAKTATLVKRFSETRRRHPLSGQGLTVEECIREEQELLATIHDLGTRIDTSDLSASMLRTWIRDLTDADMNKLTLVFESFGFKHGVPLDADFMFDARCLPNPYYEPELRPLTGRDEPIAAYFRKAPIVEAMIDDIYQLVAKWLPAFGRDNRAYLTVAIGCTGGQHRSVYIAETLANRFGRDQVLLRHRELARAG